MTEATKPARRFVVSPISHKSVLEGSVVYKRLVKEGIIDALPPLVEEPAPVAAEDPAPVAAPVVTNVPKASRLDRIPTKALVADVLTDVVAENQDKLAGMTQAQTDLLLRRLLMRKLSIGKPPKEKKKAAKKVPVKKAKKKKRYKLREPVSSSEDSTSEESSE